MPQQSLDGVLVLTKPGNTNRGRKLSTVDLHIKAPCFTKKVNSIFNIKRSRSKLVSTRSSIVLSLPLQLDFLD